MTQFEQPKFNSKSNTKKYLEALLRQLRQGNFWRAPAMYK